MDPLVQFKMFVTCHQLSQNVIKCMSCQKIFKKRVEVQQPKLFPWSHLSKLCQLTQWLSYPHPTITFSDNTTKQAHKHRPSTTILPVIRLKTPLTTQKRKIWKSIPLHRPSIKNFALTHPFQNSHHHCYFSHPFVNRCQEQQQMPGTTMKWGKFFLLAMQQRCQWSERSSSKPMKLLLAAGKLGVMEQRDTSREIFHQK